MSPPCPGLSMEPRAGAAPSAGTWWRSCSAWGWTRWWPEGRAPVPSQAQRDLGHPEVTLLQSPQAQGETHPLPHPCMGKWRRDKLQPQLLVLPQEPAWGALPQLQGQNLALLPMYGGTGGAG